MDKIYTVMVVEDEDILREAINKKLLVSGITPMLSASGKDAIETLTHTPDRLPDIIWLDYHLKDMDGLSFMAELKKNPSLQNIPVIVVSNSAAEDKVQAMLALGAKQYLLKAEHRLDELVETVKKLVDEER